MSLPDQLRNSRQSLEQHSSKRVVGVHYGEQRLLCRLLGEFLAFVDTRDLMLGPRLVTDGFWEAWVTLAIARYLQPGMWCVDVGANYGYYTLLMAAACGVDGRVVACEPNPLLAEQYLPQNLVLNGLHHGVEICPKVIGNVDDQVLEFVLHEGDFATSSLEPWAYAYRCATVRVPSMTLDRLCSNWPRMDLIKVDAEGAEGLVWEGMRQTLRRFPQTVVVLEVHLGRGPWQVQDLIRQMEADGFAPRAINYEGDIVDISLETIVEQPHEHWTLWLQK
ncbi:MAG: FkbM family methyltransferase [Pirellulaceae bacterium]|nr:FkbM family methyltransferase [Pirellulaceae bacterium]